MTSDTTVAVWQDGTRLTGPLSRTDAFAWLLRHQGQSVDYATTHGGYEIREWTEADEAHDLEGALRRLPPLSDGEATTAATPTVKLFTPDGAATWHLIEFDPDAGLAFGLCDLGLGFPELGYVDLESLQRARGRLGLPIEVEIHWRGTLGDGYEDIGRTVPDWLPREVPA